MTTSTPEKLYILNVKVTYEHGSMRDTGTYEYRVLLPSVDDVDAITFSEALVIRYHEYHKCRQDYGLKAELTHKGTDLQTRDLPERSVNTWSLTK